MAVNRGARVSQMTSSGHLRRCSDADMTNKCLSRVKRCFYTIMDNVLGSLEAVDCHIHRVRYVIAVNRGARVSQMVSSGHLRRCSDADTSNKCLSRVKDASVLSWITIMGH
eukprot:scaffold3439_cov111-Skeletonema_dohrnii-CCMP3373.AAC.1